MKKTKQISWSNIAIVVGIGFAWTKLGLGAAIQSLPALSKKVPLKPDGTCPAGWIKAGDECFKL